MERDPTPSPKEDRSQRSLDDLRRRSRLRQWESSARIAVRRGQGQQPASLKEPASFGRRA
jgi:hypothetical protein